MTEQRTASEPTSGHARRLVASEALKLSYTTTAWRALAVMGALLLVIASLVASSRASAAVHVGSGRGDAVDSVTSGLFLAQLPAGVLGVLTVAGEFSTGALRSSLLATPRRTHLLAAKTFVILVVVLVAAEAAAFAAFAVGGYELRNTVGEAGVGSIGVVRCVACSGLYLAAMALLGLAIGGICRSRTAGVIGLLIAVSVLPTFVNFLPPKADAQVTRYLPTELGMDMVRLGSDHGDFGPLPGALLLGCWIFLTMTAAAARLKSADV
ncbi:hypothetical protein SAMN05216251_114156 [Actinacidiphila alni]|uniref:ABC transporter permease n=1 Tax=Actinacidiphila alni TaxID=380248 RepID=A0A1I2ITC7_9ACTN|nr:hypothetical protein [Actinacidiphila alni]SFF44873.1 hypothetical protein SAMN05216251_114156 [Actinacidiphila alni]